MSLPNRAAAPTRVVDLRSDAVTRPTPAMWAAMRADPQDWSRSGDPTVRALESRVAGLSGMDAGLFVPSGTMANTLALCTWTQPGDRFVVDAMAHVLRSEGEAFGRLARAIPIAVGHRHGIPDRGAVEAALSSGERPTLLWVENSHTFWGGTIAPVPATRELVEVATDQGLKVHIDGARLWNVAVAQATTVAELAAGADSVTLNLDKGLGCPAGSILCGSRDFVDEARGWAVAFGGVMAQAGILAACGLLALDDFEAALLRDHQLATRLARGLRDMGVAPTDPETNIVLVEVPDADAARAALAGRGVLAMARDAHTIRFVTHRDVDAHDIDRVVGLAHLLGPA
jgi:threonine aldolase